MPTPAIWAVTIMNSKAAIRTKILKIRSAISKEEQNVLEKKLIILWDKLIKKEYEANKIGIYWSYKSEISTLGIIKKILKEGNDCYLPAIIDKKRRKMIFKEYIHDSKMIENSFGILEPIGTKEIEIEELDLIILPLIAFDNLGFRVGMGLGFYDITFSTKKDLLAPLLGLAYDFQEQETCFPENHDLKMDGILTPTKFVKVQD